METHSLKFETVRVQGREGTLGFPVGVMPSLGVGLGAHLPELNLGKAPASEVWEALWFRQAPFHLLYHLFAGFSVFWGVFF